MLTQWERSLATEKSLLKAIYDAFGDNDFSGDSLVRISAAVLTVFDHLIRTLPTQGNSPDWFTTFDNDPSLRFIHHRFRFIRYQ